MRTVLLAAVAFGISINAARLRNQPATERAWKDSLINIWQRWWRKTSVLSDKYVA